MSKAYRIRYLVFLFLLFRILVSCSEFPRNKAHADIALESIEKGHRLAQVHCASCHIFPEPGLLDAKSWEAGVLPQMGPHLGIFEHGLQYYPTVRNDRFLRRDYYPEKPLVSDTDWQNIINYYIATSPDILVGTPAEDTISFDLPLFTVLKPHKEDTPPITSCVKIFTKGDQHHLIIADAGKKKLWVMDPAFNLKDSFSFGGPVVDVTFEPDEMLICNIGVLNPTNGRFGKGEILRPVENGRYMQDSIPLFDSLARPVQIQVADLDADGKKDYLICEFGYMAGCLSWMKAVDSGRYKKKILSDLPGAIRAEIRDYNNDGLPDICALFGQGDEGISLFINKGRGRFTSERLLRFPPAYGSSYFEMRDMNKDGFPDILYTCGDNADYSRVLKPYHGVYIFLNDGKYHFSQKYFFPMHGCYKAMAGDFDGDGDLDIAAISFFANYARNPREGFVYLKNTGNLHFKPYTNPATMLGRWLTMDVGDIDGNGKPDIILGNFSVGPTLMKSEYDWKQGPAFIILKNNSR